MINQARSDGKTPLYIAEQGKHGAAVVGQLRKALAAAATAECIVLKRKRSSAGEES